MRLARRVGLRVYTYLDVPPLFHRDLFSMQRPHEVASGRVCDFMRGPCTPPDPEALAENRSRSRPLARAAPHSRSAPPQYSTYLNEWLTGAKHCADVPLLTKLLALGALPGVHTADPREADLFVVPFLGGFAERSSPQMTNKLIADVRAGRGLMDKLFDHLPHLTNATAARHLFLLTNSCGNCLRRPCTECSPWHRVREGRGVQIELALTLGPSWPTDDGGRARAPPAGRRWLRQVIVPPNVMEAEFHTPLYRPLCPERAPSGGPLAGQRWKGSGGACRPNTGRKALSVFFQGAQSFNGFRAKLLDEVHADVFGRGAKGARCDCAREPTCCVNATTRTAYFHSGSHWRPTTPLGFKETIEWMQRSRLCLCPPGDVPYNKRYFTALLAGCVPVLFSFPSQVRGERNWWKFLKGPGQRDIDPFYHAINHSALGVEVRIDRFSERDTRDVTGFLDRVRATPDEVVVAKQRAIEGQRHKLLYDMSGSAEDAFTGVLRQLLTMLRPRRAAGRGAEASATGACGARLGCLPHWHQRASRQPR